MAHTRAANAQLPEAPTVQGVLAVLADAASETIPATETTGATVSGVILDTDGAAIAGAKVRLIGEGVTREQTTSEQGRYAFVSVPAGTYMLRASAPGFGEGVLPAIKIADGARELSPLALQPAMRASVDAITQEQEAELEIRQQEQQRLLGVIPNFFVTYDWQAAPLTAKQKYELEWKFLSDPVNHAINFGIAGVQQATNSLSGYGQGTTGYFKRLGADEADFVTGNLIGGAILPSLFHQDPRYFYMGKGSVWKRGLYALSTAVICRGDNGKWQFSYSGVGGDLAAGALTNLYYPKTDRDSAVTTLRNGFITVGLDGVNNLIQEFVLKHVTPKKQ